MSIKRISTGVDNLDSIVEGGFPRGSLTLLAGNPGTGKTVFSAQFLWVGAEKYDENGVYVSFAEKGKHFIAGWLSLAGILRSLKKMVNLGF